MIDRAVGRREIIALLGLLLIAGGLAMVSIPAAMITTGALLFGLAVIPLLAHQEKADG